MTTLQTGSHKLVTSVFPDPLRLNLAILGPQGGTKGEIQLNTKQAELLRQECDNILFASKPNFSLLWLEDVVKKAWEGESPDLYNSLVGLVVDAKDEDLLKLRGVVTILDNAITEAVKDTEAIRKRRKAFEPPEPG